MLTRTAQGMDVPRLPRVVQFKSTTNLLQWSQHAGRGGRNGEPAYALMLVEPSVFQVVKKRGGEKGQAKAPDAAPLPATQDVPIKEEEDSVVLPPQRKRKRQNNGNGQGNGDNEEQELDDAVTQQVEECSRDDAPAEDAEGDPDVEPRKKMLPEMRKYITTTECRSAFMNAYFDSPDPPMKGTFVSWGRLQLTIVYFDRTDCSVL